MKIITNNTFNRTSGLRQMEMDCLNSKTTSYTTAYNNGMLNQVNGPSRDSTQLWIVPKKFIRLIEYWNNFLSSGAFRTTNITYSGSTTTIEHDGLFGANIFNPAADVLINPRSSQWYTATYPSQNQVNLHISWIMKKLIILFRSYAENLNYWELNGSMKSGTFNLAYVQSGSEGKLQTYLNLDFDPKTKELKDAVSGMLSIFLSFLDEEAIIDELEIPLSSFNFDNQAGIDTVFNNIQSISWAKHLKQVVDPTTNKSENKLLASRLLQENKWLKRNVEIQRVDKPNILCAQLQSSESVPFDGTYFIDWNDPEDKPYLYMNNGACITPLLDKDRKNSHQPNYQYNLSARFWSIGTSDKNDINYDENDDVKLNINHSLHEVTKLDFIDNLTLYLKLD